MTSAELIFSRLIQRMDRTDRAVARLHSRQNNLFREGKVVEVDHANGTVIVEAHGIRTAPIPTMQQAGEVNEWTPHSVGQRVVVCCPSGDLARGFVMPGGYTDQVKQPHDQGAQKRIAIGNCVVTITGDGMVIEAGGTRYELTSAGFTQTGGTQSHDGLDVGSTHRHRDVTPGGGQTGIPV